MSQNTSITGLVIFLLAFSSAFTNVKLGSIQLEDILLLLVLAFCIAKALISGFAIRVISPLKGPVINYIAFVGSLTLLASFAARLSVFPLDDMSVLKSPVLFSFSKVLQLAAVICGFLWLTNQLVLCSKHLPAAMDAYWWVGVLSAAYAVVSYIALATMHFSAPTFFGAYGTEEGGLRARGFFNEGGPFGMYLVSVFVTGFMRRRVVNRRMGHVSVALLCIALAMSSSKAAILSATCLIFFAIVSTASFRLKLYYSVAAIAILAGASIFLNTANQLIGYWYSYQNFDEQLVARGDDLNLVVGRVSALHIVPKMITAHPWTGIGFGNYPLMRNDPQYLDGLPVITEVEDLPALGIPSIAAEIGIPGTIWLTFLLFRPYRKARKSGRAFAVAALFLPLAVVFAVQLTFFYPWFVAACASAASLAPADQLPLIKTGPQVYKQLQ